MTPLQIVQAIRDADDGLYRLLPSEAVDLILGAENDAIDRAAAVVLADLSEDVGPNVAALVRQLKHPV